MKFCIHRGTKQIGGSCVEVESSGQHLLLDLGLPLDAEENSPEYLPAIQGLDGNDPSFLGILISHPHFDHFGLISHISKNIPVGMGNAARRILNAASNFIPGGWNAPANGWNYNSEEVFEVGPFRITPYLVDHSAYDSYALLVEADGKKLFYSGDFRAHGRKSVLFDRIVKDPPCNIEALLLEGSTIGRLDDAGKFPTETDIEDRMAKIFSETTGLAMVHASSQNIDRIVSIMRASKRSERKMVIDLYTAAILEATGNPNIPQSCWDNIALFIPHSQRIQIKKNASFDLLERHKKNRIYMDELQDTCDKTTLLFRPLHMRDLERGNCLFGATYIYSQWEGYWTRGNFDNVKKWIEHHSIPKHSVHTSGHASPSDLKSFAKALAPRKVIPIHSFEPERYPELFDNVEIVNDGEWKELK